MRTCVVLLVIVLACTAQQAQAEVLRIAPFSDAADGVEWGDSLWLVNGLPDLHYRLVMGYRGGGSAYEPALQFRLADFARGDSVAYARLRFTSLGSYVPDTLHIEIRGLLHTEDIPFGPLFRPSQCLTTQSVVHWPFIETWPFDGPWDPHYAFGPDITCLVNEILSNERWPVDPSPNASFALSIDMAMPHPGSDRDAIFSDSGDYWPPVKLELFPTVEDAFIAPIMIGRVTDVSATVNFSNLLSLDCYVAYGEQPNTYNYAQGASRTLLPDIDPIPATTPDGVQEIVLSDLTPDRECYARLFFRLPGRTDYQESNEFHFHTQRPPGESFRFCITSDSHLEEKYDGHKWNDIELYKRTMLNLSLDCPDFQVDVGDYALTINAATGVQSFAEAKRIYTDQRALRTQLGGSVPFYLVMGNHEGELGWLYRESLGIHPWSVQARKEYIPNPYPDEFYLGNEIPDPELGILENYYAWEWGDALFAVLDPFRSTLVKPHTYGGGGSRDGWDWSLGQDQYEWLVDVLKGSSRRWKFVFIHHMTGGVLEDIWGPYGRGGIEGVRHSVAGLPSFEWGGEDETGNHIFAEKRPGWIYGDLHSVMVNTGVTVVFHGHDHFFGMQELDGVIYQECPSPSSAIYDYGMKLAGAYQNGVFFPNSGHLRVSVQPAMARVEYIRSYLSGDGLNGEVAFSYSINDQGVSVDGAPALMSDKMMRLRPVPCRDAVWLDPLRPWSGEVGLCLFDASGRRVLARTLTGSEAGGTVRWDLTLAGGRRLPAGVYNLRVENGSRVERHKVVVTR